MEKKAFWGNFIEKIEVYPRKLPNGRFLKSIYFKFPIFYEGEEIIGLCWDKGKDGHRVPTARKKKKMPL